MLHVHAMQLKTDKTNIQTQFCHNPKPVFFNHCNTSHRHTTFIFIFILFYCFIIVALKKLVKKRLSVLYLRTYTHIPYTNLCRERDKERDRGEGDEYFFVPKWF